VNNNSKRYKSFNNCKCEKKLANKLEILLSVPLKVVMVPHKVVMVPFGTRRTLQCLTRLYQAGRAITKTRLLNRNGRKHFCVFHMYALPFTGFSSVAEARIYMHGVGPIGDLQSQVFFAVTFMMHERTGRKPIRLSIQLYQKFFRLRSSQSQFPKC